MLTGMRSYPAVGYRGRPSLRQRYFENHRGGRATDRSLVIIDEAHFYRNELLSEVAKGRQSLVYKRIHRAVDSGAKIVLLTATPYATNVQNLHSLLFALPHT